MDGILHLASAGDKGFFDATFLYISGGALVVAALAFAFLGMRNPDFPSSSQLRVVAGITVVLVGCTAVGAVLSARYEQAERRAENEEAAKEAAAETAADEEELAPLTEGEAAEPGTATGEASSPEETSVDGKALFVDSGCGDCHTLADAGTSGQIGPALDDVLAGQDAEMIQTSIVDPGASIEGGFPDGVMPAVYGDQLTDAELDALVAYLGDVAGNK